MCVSGPTQFSELESQAIRGFTRFCWPTATSQPSTPCTPSDNSGPTPTAEAPTLYLKMLSWQVPQDSLYTILSFSFIFNTERMHPFPS